MAESVKELRKILDSADKILISGPQSPNVDTISTAVAWWLFLTSKNKVVDIAFDGDHPKLDFIPTGPKPKKKLEGSDSFKIIVDISKSKVKQLSYDVVDDKLMIDILPDRGTFEDKDVRTERGDFHYDLILTIGALNFEQIGNLFQSNKDLWHKTPIVNIDNSILNENFGQLNIVDSNKTSLAELCTEILEDEISEDMATCLLGGLIAATNSFQSSKVTPETLELASGLIIKGAKRDKIMDSLYKTKDIDTLKNWGRVLSRLEREGRIITSWLQHDEIESLPHYFKELVRELILSSPGSQVVMISYQVEVDKTEIWLYCIDNLNAVDLAKDYKAEGDRSFAKFTIDKKMDDAREMIENYLQEKLRIINGE